MKKWLTYISLATVSTLIGVFWFCTGLFWVSFQRNERLPRWLWWFYTEDALLTGYPSNPAVGGGDMAFFYRWNGWEANWPRFQKLIRHVRRWWWLVRNPSNGFDNGPAGREVLTHLLVYTGKDPDEQRPKHGTLRIAYLPDNTIWEYYTFKHILPPGQLFGLKWRGVSVRFRAGWKMKGYIGKVERVRMQFVFAPGLRRYDK